MVGTPNSKNAVTASLKQALNPVQVVSISPLQWACMTCFILVYASVNTSMALLVLPVEAERLNDKKSASIWVGVYLTVCGITQLACPLAGKLSDRHASRWGRRRPFIVAGTVFAAVGFVFLWTASRQRWPITYLVSLFFTQLAVNVAYSATCGLPPDIQDSQEGSNLNHTKGVVSGIVSLHSFLGSLVAMSVMISTRRMPIQVQYLIYIGSLFVTCIVACSTAVENSTAHVVNSKSLTLKEVAQSFWIDLHDDLNFFWVCVGRLFYYISTSVVVFMFYYLRDMLDIQDGGERRTRLGILVVMAQVVGAMFTIPLSRLSNTIGRKPVIYAACAVMFMAFALYSVAPILTNGGAWPVALCATMCFGIGSGAYLSVDYALASDFLPIRKTAAEAFGIWGVAGFMGSTAGPMVGGSLLAAFNEAGKENYGPKGNIAQYSYTAYVVVMMLLGCLMNVLVVLVTSRIGTVQNDTHDRTTPMLSPAPIVSSHVTVAENDQPSDHFL